MSLNSNVVISTSETLEKKNKERNNIYIFLKKWNNCSNQFGVIFFTLVLCITLTSFL